LLKNTAAQGLYWRLEDVALTTNFQVHAETCYLVLFFPVLAVLYFLPWHHGFK
jgi:hypothetical protein